jgi:hypothetical protein
METGKTSKYFKYAIGEIVLVVIGILIALQINNWNQNRLERQKEKVILKQLYQDFEANDSIIKKGFKSMERLIAKNESILKHTGPTVILPKGNYVKDSLLNLEYPKVNLVNSSLNSSPQQVDVLTNQQLKVALSKFPSIYVSYKEVEEQVKEHTIEQRRINKKYVSIISLDSDFNQENFDSDMLGFLRDRDFQNTTVDKRWNMRNALKELKILNEQNQMVLELIKKELNMME